MASLIEQPDFDEHASVPRQVQEVQELPPAPRWFKVVCGICWVVVLVSIAGVFFFTPAFSAPSEAAETTDEETPNVEEVESAALDSEVAEATAAIQNNLSAEDAEAISNDAYDLAQQIASAQANARTNMYDEELYDEWIKKLQELLPEAPNQAVVWYTPSNDTEFSWDTFQPYIFEADKVSAAEPAVRVLWLARLEDGTVLSWARALYDANSSAFVDFERGITSEGYALIPIDREEFESEDDALLSDMQETIKGLQDLNPVLPDEEEVTEEQKQDAFALREANREKNGVSFE